MGVSIAFLEPSLPAAAGWATSDVCWASGFNSGSGFFVLCGDRSAGTSRIVTTPDGVTFTFRVGPTTTGFWRGIAYSPTLNRAVVVGQGGIVGWSDDGITWANATTFPTANNWQAVCWWAAKSLFVAVSNNGVFRVATSANGKDWTNVTAAAAKSWVAIQASAGAVVALARDAAGSTQVLMRATDNSAASWALVTTNSYLTSGDHDNPSGGSSGIGYSSTLGQLCTPVRRADGTRLMITSTDDGATWAEQSLPTPTDGNQVWGSIWIDQQWFTSKFSDFKYLGSADGVTWMQTAQASPPTNSNYGAWAWSPTLKVILSGVNTTADTALVGTVTFSSLTSLTPSLGTKRGGTVVTLTGAGFTGATSVTFGGTAAVSVNVINDTTLTCVTPPHVVGLFDVTVVGVATLTNAYTFVSVDSVHPRAGTVAGGTSVTITGFGFSTPALAVLFDDVAVASFTIVSNTSITTTTPEHDMGVVDVTVTGVDVGAHLYTYTLPIPQNLGKGPLLPPIPIRRTP